MNIPELEWTDDGFTYAGKLTPSHAVQAIETHRLAKINQQIADTLGDIFELLEGFVNELKDQGDSPAEIPQEEDPPNE